MKIVSLGEITVDRYLRQNLSLVGGISLNFAVNAKRSGADHVSLVSCIGNGPVGSRVLEALAREQVDSSHVSVLPGMTAECDIDVFPNADRVFPPGGYRVNVLERLQLTGKIKGFIEQHDIAVTLYDGQEPDALVQQLLPALPERCKRVVDFGDWSGGNRRKAVPQTTLNALDIAFISGDESTVTDWLPVVTALNCLVVVTLGAGGSVALTPAGAVRQAALPVDKPVDATGCGDAFQAAFTVNYFRDGDIRAALRAGAARAAKVLTHYGAFAQNPF